MVTDKCDNGGGTSRAPPRRISSLSNTNIMEEQQTQKHESPPPPAQQQNNQMMDNKILEGTLIYRKGGRLKKNMRMYTVFDMSGAAGASLEVGGIGSLKCYRFPSLSKKDAAAAYSSTKFSSGCSDQTNHPQDEDQDHHHQSRELCFSIPGHLPWTVVDMENDPTAFVVQISTSGYEQTHSSSLLVGEHDNNDAADGGNDNDNIESGTNKVKKDLDAATDNKSEVNEEASDEGNVNNNVNNTEDGFFDFWGGEDDDESEEGEHDDNEENKTHPHPATDATATRVVDQVQLALSRAVSKNKPYIKYEFKCNREKALWLAAFNKAGRLSEESKKKKKNLLFGGVTSPAMVSASQRNSRIRSSNAYNVKMFTSSLVTSNIMDAAAENNNNGKEEEEEQGPQKEYRVRPNYAYMHQWMTHSELTEEMNAPSTVMHDTRLSPTQGDYSMGRELGLLRVEVLSCLGLPRQKGNKGPNAVVYLVCGSYAFTTDVIDKCQSPMWLGGMRRACALPIYHGYAVLMAGVFHDDGTKSSSKDTFLGRVEVPIAQLRPNTISYDVTLPLRQSKSVYTRKKLGAVRLRISVEYYDERQAICSYLPQRRNQFKTTVACADPKSFRNIALTVHGTHLLDKFSPDMIKAAIRELSFVQAVMVRSGKKFVRDVISWRQPIYSAWIFGGWMHCVYMNSIALAPVYLMGFVLLHLAANYSRFAAGGVADFQPPSWKELLSTLWNNSIKDAAQMKHKSVAGDSNAASMEFPFAAVGGYQRLGVDECLNDSKLNSDSDDKLDGFSDDELEETDANDDLGQKDEIGQEALTPFPEQNVDAKVGSSNKTSNKTIADELKEVELKVHKATGFLFDYQTYHPYSDGQEALFGKKVTKDSENSKFNQELDKVLGVGQFSQWNPMVSKVTSQFIPISRILSAFLSVYRSLYSIFTWRDPILTFYFSIAIIVSILVLILFPWRIFMTAIGLAFLGPQNWLIRIFRERFQSSSNELRRRPGRILRAARELLKDDDGNSVKELNVGGTSMHPQPVFRCHAPSSNPALERTGSTGAQHIVVPYSLLYFNRFQDWPPDPKHARVSEALQFNESLCVTSCDFVSAPGLRKPLPSVLPTKAGNGEGDKSATLLVLEQASQKPEIKPKAEVKADRITPPSLNPQKADQIKRLVESNVAENNCSQPEAKKKNLFTARMVARFRKTTDTVNDDTISADEGTVGGGIPSFVETTSTSNTGDNKGPDCEEISCATAFKSEDTHRVGRNETSTPNHSGQVTGVESESKQDQGSNAGKSSPIERRYHNLRGSLADRIKDKLGEKANELVDLLSHPPSDDDNNLSSGMADAASVVDSPTVYEAIGEEENGESESKQEAIGEEEKSSSSEPNGDDENNEDGGVVSKDIHQVDRTDSGKDISNDDNIVNTTTSVADDSASSGAPLSLGENRSDGETVDNDLIADSDALQLQHLLELKLELATARTQNDKYHMLLKEMEAERDMYKEKYERTQNRIPGSFNLFNRKDRDNLR